MIQPEKFGVSETAVAAESKKFQRGFGDKSPNPILTTIYSSAAMWGRYNIFSIWKS